MRVLLFDDAGLPLNAARTQCDRPLQLPGVVNKVPKSLAAKPKFKSENKVDEREATSRLDDYIVKAPR